MEMLLSLPAGRSWTAGAGLHAAIMSVMLGEETQPIEEKVMSGDREGPCVTQAGTSARKGAEIDIEMLVRKIPTGFCDTAEGNNCG